MRRPLAVCLVVALLAVTPVAAAATPISGTVTVANGSADGARVTVVPVSQTLQQVGNASRTRVQGSSFSVDAAEAPRHVVRVDYDGATHFEVLENRTHADISLSANLTGRVVDADGAPRSNVTVELVDETGFSVDQARTGPNGTFAFGPLETDETYRVRVDVDGVPYRRSVNASETDSVTVRTRPPTNDSAALAVANATPSGHVVQVVAPGNGSNAPSAIETLSLRNTADRPFAGTVTIPLPADAEAYAAMAEGRETNYTRTDAGVRLNVTVPANGTAQVGAAYDLAGPRFEKRLGRDAPSVAVVLRGYDPGRVNHSENLRVGDAPIALLTTDGPVSAGETISVSLADARTSGTTNASVESAPADSGSIPTFPAGRIFGGLAAMVVAGLVGYRTVPELVDRD